MKSLKERGRYLRKTKGSYKAYMEDIANWIKLDISKISFTPQHIDSISTILEPLTHINVDNGPVKRYVDEIAKLALKNWFIANGEIYNDFYTAQDAEEHPYIRNLMIYMESLRLYILQQLLQNSKFDWDLEFSIWLPPTPNPSPKKYKTVVMTHATIDEWSK